MINKRTINVYNLTNSWNVNLFTGLGTLAMGAVYNLTNSWNVNFDLDEDRKSILNGI